jgi:hypothetical protein
VKERVRYPRDASSEQLPVAEAEEHKQQKPFPPSGLLDVRHGSAAQRPRCKRRTEPNEKDCACRSSNIIISRIFSAYFLGLLLISAANAEEEPAFFGGSFSENKCLPERRKAISRVVAAAAEIARSRPRCAAGKSLFSADGRGVRRLDSAIYSLSQQPKKDDRRKRIQASLRSSRKTEQNAQRTTPVVI